MSGRRGLPAGWSSVERFVGDLKLFINAAVGAVADVGHDAIDLELGGVPSGEPDEKRLVGTVRNHLLDPCAAMKCEVADFSANQIVRGPDEFIAGRPTLADDGADWPVGGVGACGLVSAIVFGAAVVARAVDPRDLRERRFVSQLSQRGDDACRKPIAADDERVMMGVTLAVAA